MNSSYSEIESKLRGHFRFLVIAWGFALPIMYTLLIWLTSLCDAPDRHWWAIAASQSAACGFASALR
jgi:hypothetical protein